jgi:PIN domain-containing protein
MAIETRHIFLDTEFYIANNFEFSEQRFTALVEWAEAKKLFIYITDITEKEIYAQISKRILEACSELKKFRANENCRILLNIGGAYNEVFGRKPNKDKMVKELEEQFESFKEEASISTIATDSVSIPDIFSKYFAAKPPFKEGKKKNEFPDAFVITALEDWCNDNAAKMYIVSKDPDMISAADESEYLISVNDLDQLLDDLAKHEHELLYMAIHLAVTDSISSLKDEIKHDFEFNGEFVLDEIEGDVDNVAVESVDIYKWSIVNIDQDTERVTVDANISIDYKADITYAEMIVEDMPIGYEEEEIERHAYISAEITYVFDPQTRKVEFEGLDLRMKPIILSRWPPDEDLK